MATNRAEFVGGSYFKGGPGCASEDMNDPRRRYLASLWERLGIQKRHLSEVASLSEQWDRRMESGDEAIHQLEELRPFLAVDRAVLENDIAALLRQIEMVEQGIRVKADEL